MWYNSSKGKGMSEFLISLIGVSLTPHECSVGSQTYLLGWVHKYRHLNPPPDSELNGQLPGGQA